MIKIYVESKADKKALLKESEYIHYLSEIDSDKASFLMHLYMSPELIIVKKPKKTCFNCYWATNVQGDLKCSIIKVNGDFVNTLGRTEKLCNKYKRKK